MNEASPESVDFSSWEWLAKSKPRGHREKQYYQEMLGERYDELLAEKQWLNDQLASFDFRDYGAIGDPDLVDNKTLEEINAAWKEKVRRETSFLKPLDDLKINIFCDDLENQPGFPDEKINFSSKKIHRDQIVKLKAIGGSAGVHEPRIEIGTAKLPLRHQLALFLHHGTLDPTVSILVHELIHRHHSRSNANTDNVLTEAQAYFSGIFEAGPHFSITKIAKTLTEFQDGSRALYGFNAHQVIEALRAIAILYGLGMSYDDVSALVINSHYDPQDKIFRPLNDVVKKTLKKFNLDDIDAQALDDLYRLFVNNQRQRAKLLLFQTIAERYPIEELRALSAKKIRERIFTPTYYDADGKPRLPDNQLGQMVVCPCDSQFPYDPNNKRSGVVFGLFTTSKNSEPSFGIGRWEAEANKASTTLAPNADEEARYIAILRNQAKNISLESKHLLLDRYSDLLLLDDQKARQTILSLINYDEALEILRQDCESMVERLALVLEGVESVVFNKILSVSKKPDWISSEDTEKLEAYRLNIGWLETKFKFLALRYRKWTPRRPIL